MHRLAPLRPIRPLALPLIALAAATTALAGVAAVPSLGPDEPRVVARSAAAPRTVDAPAAAPALTSVLDEKAARRGLSTAAARAQVVAERARDLAAAAAERTRAAQRASRARTASTDPRAIARSLLAASGQAGQFGCLDRLWQRESEWRVTARNPSSGAYGIPQSLPASKLASAGADWRTSARTQIRWGLGYIDERYGSPCAAWAHSQSHGWY